MKRLLTIVAILIFALPSFASTTQVEIDTVTINSQFFVAIIAGVLLALIFQILLTALSVALGITMVGNLKQSYVENRVRPNSDTRNKYKFDQDYDSGTATGLKISTAFGVWSLLTTAISLFAACALALSLSFFGSIISNITVALVIWALFFLILFYLEVRIVNTVLGGLVTTATSGLKSSASAVKQLFKTSEDKKIKNTIDHTIEKVRQEFDINLNTVKLSEVMDKFFAKVDNKLPNYDTLKSDLENIAKKSKSKNTSGKFMAIQQVLTKAIEKSDETSTNSTDGKNEQLKKLLSELKEAYTSDTSTVEGVKDVVSNYTSLEKEQIDKKLQQLKDYISSSTPESLTKENISEDFNRLLADPTSANAILSERFGNFDREQIVNTLAENTKLDKEQLNHYADTIESTIKKVRKTIADNDINTVKASAERSIANFLKRTEREELNYDNLKKDFNAILNNPKESLSIIKSRLSKMDTDTIRALVTNNKYINEEHIDAITGKVDETIASIKQQVASIEQKANEQFEMTKRKAIIQAEHARKTAASAAWWLVVTIIISGGAAILGAWLELG